MAYGAYAGDPEVGQQILHVVELEGSSEPKPLPVATTMSWSPDGSQIAYREFGCITGTWDIYTIDPGSVSMERLTSVPEGPKEGPFWSPASTTIAFSTFGELMLADAESGELQTLATSGGSESYRPGIHLHDSVWSPDGRYIQFSAGGAHGICD
jgi:Tol biopolymer transport system component